MSTQTLQANASGPSTATPRSGIEAGPLVSIGMPLYNGARYLREAIDALLAQEYENFELIISDNASEDETEAICREYAARDARVRYLRAERNMGAPWNFSRVFELSGGKYFMWAAFDDLRHPLYLKKCVAALEANPRAALCCTDLHVIDEEGREVDDANHVHGIRPVGATPIERSLALARAIFWTDIYGLMPRRVLAETWPLHEVWGGDVVKLLELCLRGEVLAIPEKLFSYRIFTQKKAQDTASSMDSADGRTRIVVGWGHLALEMLRAIWKSPLGFSEKVALTRRFTPEFCLRNGLVRNGIRGEGLSLVKLEWAGKRYGRSLCISLINLYVGASAARARLRRTLGF